MDIKQVIMDNHSEDHGLNSDGELKQISEKHYIYKNSKENSFEYKVIDNKSFKRNIGLFYEFKDILILKKVRNGLEDRPHFIYCFELKNNDIIKFDYISGYSLMEIELYEIHNEHISYLDLNKILFLYDDKDNTNYIGIENFIMIHDEVKENMYFESKDKVRSLLDKDYIILSEFESEYKEYKEKV